MKVDKQVLKAWRKEIDKDDIYTEAAEIGSDARTIREALKTGRCHQNVHDKINAYILRKRKRKNPLA